MKYKILFILLFVWVKAFAQPTIQDTTRMLVFDPVKSWVTTMLDVKTYVGAGGGGGTVTNTGGALTLNALVLGAGTNDTKVSTGLTTDGGSLLILGVNSTTIGQLKLFGNTSGDVTIKPTAAAGTATVQTLPATTGTLVNRVTTGNGVSASNTDGALSFTLGAITPTTVNGNTFTTGSSTYTGTAGQTYTFPTTTASIARTDAAQTFTGAQTFSTPIAATSIATMTATVGGAVPTPPNNTTTFLRGDGTFAVPSGGGGGGDILNGGNTTGATVVIGTNDANALSFETNGVVRQTMTGGASTGGARTMTDVSANTATLETMNTYTSNSSGTAATGFGIRNLYQLETTTTNGVDAVSIDAVWSNASNAAPEADFVVSNKSSLDATPSMDEHFRIVGSGQITQTALVTTTNTVSDLLTLRVNSTGTAAGLFGGGILFKGESSTTDNRDIASINAYWINATDASRRGEISFKLAQSTALTGSFRMIGNGGGFEVANASGSSTSNYNNTGITPGVNFTIGGNASTILVGTNTGLVNINSTSTGAATAVLLNATGNNANASGTIGNTTFTTTSFTKYDWRFSSGYTVSSGTGGFYSIFANPVINQTVSTGASGFMDIAPTLTNIAGGYRALNCATSNAGMIFINQTGTATTNVLVGKTSHGTTSAPTALVMFAAGTTAANTAPAKFTSGPLMTTPESGAVEFLTDAAYLTTTTGTVRRMLVGSQCARATAQTAANASVATFTTPAVDGTYEVSGHITVTTSSAEAFSLTVDYTDESNTARTATIPILRSSSGAWLSTTLSAAGAVAYPSATIPIRCKASTAITIKTSGTFTGCTYNVEGCIKQVN